MVNKIKGGLADNKTLEQIAEKHGVELSSITLQLEEGIKVEMEHTDSEEQATEIAKDHLFEDAEYYSKLKNIEKQNEAGHWITVKPHEDSKGTHVFIKEGQTAKEAIDEKFEDKKESKKEDIGTYIDERGKTKSLKNLKSIIDYMDWQDDSINFAKGIEGEGKIKGENYVIFAPYKVTKLGGMSTDQRDGIKQNYLRKITNVLKGKTSEIQERGDGTFAIIYDENKIKEALSKKEKQNSKDWAKTYKASNFIEKGVCTYNDETIYLSQEALNKAIQTIKGRPVVIKHQKVTPQNMEDHAVGYVSDCGFCAEDASFYCHFLVFDDEGKEVIAKDYSVSCAYIPKAFGKGGTWHNTPYDREVTELEFTHLALVPDPRYEDAKIYENAKGEDKEGRWITVKGNHIFVEEGQDVQEAIDKQFSKKEIEFTGKNTKDLKELLGDNLKVSDNGKITVNTEKGNITILKEDKVTIDGNNIEIKKPSYSGGKIIKAKLKDSKSFNYVDDGENIQIVKDDNNKYHIHYGVNKEGKATSIASGFESLEEAEKTLKKHRPNYTEKQNSTDNTTKETYNMEKIEVEQGFLASLIELAQKPFLNSKKEVKEKEEEVEIDDDEMEYEGKKYSKKELVNAFLKGEAKPEVKEEKEMKNAVEIEEEVEQPTDEDMEFFNSMQKLMAEAQSDASDKVEIPSQTKGLELGSKAFG